MFSLCVGFLVSIQKLTNRQDTCWPLGIGTEERILATWLWVTRTRQTDRIRHDSSRSVILL